MTVLTMIKRLPQPLKTLYVLYFVVFAATFVSIVVGGERAAAMAGVGLGVVAVLSGLTIATNLNGGADALAEGMKTYRPLGIDYSRSVFASPRFTRLFGVFMVLVGVPFVIGFLSQL